MIHTRFLAVLTELNERGTRRWAAAEAMAIRRGGISAVSNATGLSRVTIRKGIAELSSEPLLPDRQRRPGAGRKTRESEQPSLIETLEIVINLIVSTRTETGLEVHAYLDKKDYPDKLKVTDDQLAEVQLVRNKFHGEWNYEIQPQS